MTKTRFNSFLFLVYFCSLFSAMGQGSESRPNVLMIAVDDWNDWVGAMGYAQAISPNLDRLAGQGVLFNNAHCSAVYCAPSRTSIMTGQYPSTNGCYTNEIHYTRQPDLVDLPGWFMQDGYSTHGGGKLYHHMPGCIDIRSWDEYFLWNEDFRRTGWRWEPWGEGSPLPENLPVSDIAKAIWDRQGQKGNLPTHWMEFGPLANDQENQLADTILTDWAVDFLGKEQQEPFFLGYGLYAPHKPNFVPQKYFDMHRLEDIELPPWNENDLDDLPPNLKSRAMGAKRHAHDPILATNSAKKEVQAYLAACSYADDMIGRVLDALESSPYRNNTIIVLWSDHGYHHGEKLRWTKHTLWERTSHIPMIWAGPGIPKNQVCNDTVSLVDIYPTLIDLCGLPEKQDLDGISLRGHLNNPAMLTDRSVLQVMEKSVSVINRQWRYTRYFDGEEELYNQETDPNEWDNLANDPELEQVKIQLGKHVPTQFAEPGDKPWDDIRLKNQGDSFYWERIEKNTYNLWRDDYFDDADLQGEPMVDVDGDGYHNLMEYALRSDPKDVSSFYPASMVASDDSLSFQYRRNKEPADLQFQVMVSPDMKNWVATNSPESVSDIDATNEAVHLNIAPDGRSFIRLHVSMIE